MNQRSVAAALAMSLFVGVVSAAPPKRPWEWEPAERAAARRDPVQRLERVEAHRAELRAKGVSRVPPAADVIDGRTHPELFFVSELFEILVRSSFVTMTRVFPNMVRQRSSDLFRDRAEWDELTAIARDYAAVLAQERNAANAGERQRVTDLHAVKCEAAARALREARRKFGRARFDRLLYETIAPDLRTVFSIDTDFQTSIGKALEREQRCQ